METVELRGLRYDLALQDENSGFSVMLSSVLKSKVSPYTVATILKAQYLLFKKYEMRHFHFLTD